MDGVGLVTVANLLQNTVDSYAHKHLPCQTLWDLSDGEK